MKPSELTVLALRLIGIYVLIEAVPSLAINVISASQMREPSDSGHSTATLFGWLVLPLILRIGIGIVLLMRADVLAQKFILRKVADEVIPPVSFEQVQLLAFAVAGVMIFSGALPQLFKCIFDLGQSFSDSSLYWAAKWRLATTAVGTLLKGTLGLALFFRARDFANWSCSSQTFGARKPPEIR